MPDQFKPGEFLKLVKAVLDAVPTDPTELVKLNNPTRKKLAGGIEAAVKTLRSLIRSLDPILMPEFVLDPSQPEVTGELIANKLLEQPRRPLGSLPRFYGSGVYAIYYNGAFPAYAPIRGKETPIYTGTADPEMQNAPTPVEQGLGLCARLRGDHARSIRRATNLDIDDFECRYLVVVSAWSRTAEQFLIDWFMPVWNNEASVCYGFGKHGDKATTRGNTRSPWDTLHPGRPWASGEENKPNPLTTEQLMEQIAEHYRKYPPKV